MPAAHQTPLAERVRPQTPDEIIGQNQLLGENGPLRRMLRAGTLPSMLFWGPPGTGKTTLAEALARQAQLPFVALSAISSGVKEVRETIQKARLGKKTLVFIDEIHRFNKSQQDALLGAVERGYITLIGATTENPSFEVNRALLSRCQVFTLESLSEEDLQKIAQRALEKDKILAPRNLQLLESEALLYLSGGDARKLLNLLEFVANLLDDGEAITNEVVRKVATKQAAYDKGGEQHYDIISAFIKSIRGSDPNAALYWLARMLEGGESLRFIARRLVISASEDIGNANPTALVMALNTFQAVDVVGYPEAEIILGQCVTYLASSPKSNASYKGIKTARRLVKETGDLPVPLHLRNAPTKLMKKAGYGQGYKYSHDFPGNFAAQEYFPDELSKTKLYDPGENAREAQLRKFLQSRWKEKYGY